MTNTETQLAHDLVDLGYTELFMRYDEEAIDSIWDRPNAPAALAELVLDSSAADQARFLAAEVLFARDDSYPPDSVKSQLAPVYAAALTGNYTEMANPWGLPEELDGEVGQHVVQLGESAVPSLVPLLEDDTSIQYGGSKEATYGNAYQYRVKDVAAFLIGQITGLAYEVHMSPTDRDTEIETLKFSLP
jgi:hypothetical protein